MRYRHELSNDQDMHRKIVQKKLPANSHLRKSFKMPVDQEIMASQIMLDHQKDKKVKKLMHTYVSVDNKKSGVLVRRAV